MKRGVSACSRPIRALALFRAVATTEFVDLTSGVEHLLLTRVERVAVGANLNVQVFPRRRASCEFVTTTTSNRDLVVLWMDFRFHFILPPRKKRYGILCP